MKLLYIMMVSISTMFFLLTGCSQDDKNTEDSELRIYSLEETKEIENLLKAYPVDYNSENAIQDGLVVISNDFIIGGEEKWNDFISKVKDEKNDSIIIATVSSKGDMRLLYLVNNNNQLFGYFDMTRVRESSIDYYSTGKEYRFLNIYDNMGEQNVVLVNDKSMTYEEIANDLANGLNTICHLFTFKNND